MVKAGAVDGAGIGRTPNAFSAITSARDPVPPQPGRCTQSPRQPRRSRAVLLGKHRASRWQASRDPAHQRAPREPVQTTQPLTGAEEPSAPRRPTPRRARKSRAEPQAHLGTSRADHRKPTRRAPAMVGGNSDTMGTWVAPTPQQHAKAL